MVYFLMQEILTIIMTIKKSNSLEARLIRAKTFAQTWRAVAPNLILDELDVNGFADVVETLERSYMTTVSQEAQLDETRQSTEKQATQAELIETNVRNTAKIRFGADSLQYGQLGGVRTSERKRPNRRKNSDKPAVASPMPATS